ncbi:MAG: tetratricopeptide repeat protein [Acidobacteriota bacterium]|nr:tetratricopeptide repeat protein [Acidobacteriota bacterium]
MAIAGILLSLNASGQQANPAEMFQQALEAQRRGDDALAVREYREIVSVHPEITAAHANLAAALVSLGKYSEAIAEYQTALKQAPGNHALELNLAVSYFKKGSASDAARILMPLSVSDPGNERIAILLADCDLRLGRYAEAASLLQPFEKSNPGNLDVEWPLGSALIGAGRAQEGLALVERVAQQGPSAEAYMLAAQTYLKLERFNLARRDVDAAMKLNPHLPGLDTINGMVLDYFGDAKGAEAAFQKAIASNPTDFQALLRLGALEYSQRQLTQAATHLRRALELEPSSSVARYELGRVERAQGNLAAAVKDLEKAESEKPDWLPPHIELAALYYRVNRPKDGERERRIVDQLSAKVQKDEARKHVISPELPSQ